MRGVGQEEFSGACGLLESQGILGIKRTKDLRNDKVSILESSQKLKKRFVRVSLA